MRTGRPRKEIWARCKIAGCYRSSEGGSFGMCRTHYMALRRGRLDKDGNELRPAQRVRSYGNGARCSVPDCGRRPKGRGLCTMHYQQWESGRTLVIDIPERGYDKSISSYRDTTCLVPDCTNRPVDHWMCSKHAQQRAAGILDAQGNQLRELKPNGRPRSDKWVGQAGYVLVQAPEGHPYARKDGSILEHRLVAEEKAGCYLDPDEFLVHHKDGDRGNNIPENVEVLPYKAHGPGKSADADTTRRVLTALRANDPAGYYDLLGEIQAAVVSEEAMETMLSAQIDENDREACEQREALIDTAMSALRHRDKDAYERVCQKYSKSADQVVKEETDKRNPKGLN